MAGQISPEREASYYFGLLFVVVGFLLFAFVFFSFALNFGNFGAMEHTSGRFPLAFIGIGIIFAGGILMKLGRRGLAGSGLLLDPEKAREDVEPWSRMAGGVVKDALDAADLKPGGQKSAEAMPFDEELRRLRKLCDDHLISEDEYVTKKKEVMERA